MVFPCSGPETGHGTNTVVRHRMAPNAQDMLGIIPFGAKNVKITLHTGTLGLFDPVAEMYVVKRTGAVVNQEHPEGEYLGIPFKYSTPVYGEEQVVVNGDLPTMLEVHVENTGNYISRVVILEFTYEGINRCNGPPGGCTEYHLLEAEKGALLFSEWAASMYLNEDLAWKSLCPVGECQNQGGISFDGFPSVIDRVGDRWHSLGEPAEQVFHYFDIDENGVISKVEGDRAFNLASSTESMKDFANVFKSRFSSCNDSWDWAREGSWAITFQRFKMLWHSDWRELGVVAARRLANSKHAPSNDTCDATDVSRKECTFIGIDQKGCEDEGCCFSKIEPNPYDLPWCYEGLPEDACVSNIGKRIRYGISGISQQQCGMEGGCWIPTADVDEPWCFRLTSSRDAFSLLDDNRNRRITRLEFLQLCQQRFFKPQVHLKRPVIKKQETSGGGGVALPENRIDLNITAGGKASHEGGKLSAESTSSAEGSNTDSNAGSVSAGSSGRTGSDGTSGLGQISASEGLDQSFLSEGSGPSGSSSGGPQVDGELEVMHGELPAHGSNSYGSGGSSEPGGIDGIHEDQGGSSTDVDGSIGSASVGSGGSSAGGSSNGEAGSSLGYGGPRGDGEMGVEGNVESVDSEDIEDSHDSGSSGESEGSEQTSEEAPSSEEISYSSGGSEASDASAESEADSSGSSIESAGTSGESSADSSEGSSEASSSFGSGGGSSGSVGGGDSTAGSGEGTAGSGDSSLGAVGGNAESGGVRGTSGSDSSSVASDSSAGSTGGVSAFFLILLLLILIWFAYAWCYVPPHRSVRGAGFLEYGAPPSDDFMEYDAPPSFQEFSTLSTGFDQRVLLMLKGESPTPPHVSASYNQRELRLPPQQGHTGTSPVQMVYQTQAHHAQTQSAPSASLAGTSVTIGQQGTTQPPTPAVGRGPVALVPQPTISTHTPMYTASINTPTPNPQLTYSMQKPTPPLPPPGPQQMQGLVPRVPNAFSSRTVFTHSASSASGSVPSGSAVMSGANPGPAAQKLFNALDTNSDSVINPEGPNRGVHTVLQQPQT